MIEQTDTGNMAVRNQSSSLPIEMTSMSQPAKQKEQTDLLSLPPELRVQIYQVIFQQSKPISLRVNPDGFISKVRQKISLQFLRTCKQIYQEACPVLYKVNDFKIDVDDISSLPNFYQSSRLLIDRVLIDTRKARSTIIDFAMLGRGLPAVKVVSIFNLHSTTFLTTAYHLSKSLPCSPIRDWPTLILCTDQIARPSTADGVDGEAAQVNTTDSLDKVETMVGKPGFRLANLEKVTSYPSFKLGHEMPNFKVLKLEGGQLYKEQIQAISNHKCNFGDCRFKLMEQEMVKQQKGHTKSVNAENTRNSPKNSPTENTNVDNIDANTSDWESSEDVSSNLHSEHTIFNHLHRRRYRRRSHEKLKRQNQYQFRFIWSREGNLENSRALTRRGSPTTEEVANGMHRWCPSLPTEYYQQALEEGLIRLEQNTSETYVPGRISQGYMDRVIEQPL